MNFNAPLLRPLRVLLFPFSLVYGFVVWLRNRGYDYNIIRSTSFNLPIICVGNLSAGGTGKSPMVEYLVRLLSRSMKTAVISRGYKRKTSGYALADRNSTALEIGDEPMQIFRKFPETAIAVGEERIVAISQLLHDRPDTNVIILDDAFQHRSVKAGLNIVLTDSNHLFTRDWFLPTGNLRDERQSYKRADILVVTKCSPDLTERDKKKIIAEIGLVPGQEIFFTQIKYGVPYHLTKRSEISIDETLEVLLVSGIANPAPLKEYLTDNSRTYYELLFGDHHIFSIDDWNEIGRKYNSLAAEKKIIITTEKDAVRLLKFRELLNDLPIYVLPIETAFLFDDEGRFNNIIATFINRFNKQTTTKFNE
jgi:tetraacyldisaccharide 4'-kinase